MDEEKGPLEKLKTGLKTVRKVSTTEDAVGRYVHLGLTFALAILLFLYAGYRLDKWLGTLPLFTLIGTFTGGAGGFLYIYRELVRDGGRDDSD
jgi:F0F1-type ATP synthase assembly protein I